MADPSFDHIALVAQVGDALGSAMRPATLEDEVRSTVGRVRQVYAAAACSFARVQDDGASLRFVAADGVGAEAIVGLTLPVSRGVVGWVALSGEPIRISDVATDSRFARDVAESTDYVPTTILAVPAVDGHGDVLGVLEVLDPAVAWSSGQQLDVLGLVAAELAAVVRLSSLYDGLGRGLIRTLAEPGESGAFDDALAALAASGSGVSLDEVALAFRRLAAGGPAAARLAQRVLVEVASFAEGSARQGPRGHR